MADEESRRLLSEAQLRYLRERAKIYASEPGWSAEMQRRRAVSTKFRSQVEATGILEGRELTQDGLAELVAQVREIQNLNPIVLPQLLGTYTYYRRFKAFEGSRDDFIAHMQSTRDDWQPGSAGYPGADARQIGADIARLLSAEDQKVGPAIEQVQSYSGAGRALVSGLLLLWDPARFPLINNAAVYPFRTKAGPLSLSLEQRAALRKLGRERYGLAQGGEHTKTAKTLGWMYLFADIRERCGFGDYFEVDWLMWRLTTSSKGETKPRLPNSVGGAPERAKASAPPDPESVIAAGLKGYPPERAAVREKAVADARRFVETHLGRFGEAELRELQRLFNIDWYNGQTRANRFAPAFLGALANDIVACAPEANRWIEQIWRSETDEEVASVLDAFWQAGEVTGAGRSFPTMLLHVREPERFFPLSNGLAKGYLVLLGKSARTRKGADYLTYAKGLSKLRATHAIPTHALDLVLMAANRWKPSESAPSEPKPESPGKYGIDQLVNETLIDQELVDEIELLLSEKRQLTLYGPPGTGKTFLAERIAAYLAREGGSVHVVQFHPSYGYEDFVEGLRPTLDESSKQLTYRIESGIFRQLCETARGKPKETFVLIIDEMNRGNLPRIFGELLYLLERRGDDHSVVLPLSRQSFSVPKNLIIIGTMNTADQSIALIDVALRRRFHFVPLTPNTDLLRSWLQRHAPAMVGVADVLERLNDKLAAEGIDENLHVGHSHFMVQGLDELALRRIWERSITPTLEEYFYGKRGKIAQFRFENFVEGQIGDASEITEEIATDDDEPDDDDA